MNTKTIIEKARPLADYFLTYVDQGISPYHSTSESARRLKEQGFVELIEEETWEGKIEKGGRYFITRGGSCLVAWTVGNNFDSAKSIFKIVGTHTDSPCIRLAPKSAHNSLGYKQACIQTYGGGLWDTWFDRDLKIGGRVIIKKDGQLHYKLYDSKKAIAIIPNLCIHLSDTRKGEEAKFNNESQLRPIFATSTFEDQNEDGEASDDHYKGLFQDIAKQLDCKVEDIVDFDLCFADANKASIVGFNKEFISAPRLDNLFSSWAACHCIGLDNNMANTADINVAAMFDHEEIGSNTITGADSGKALTYPRNVAKHPGENLQRLVGWLSHHRWVLRHLQEKFLHLC